MKNIILSIISLAVTGIAAKAQIDKQAESILQGVSTKYKSFSSIKADFSYTLDNTSEKIKDTQKGTISLKGNKYKLQVSGQEVLCDGKTIWTFLKDANEVNVSEPNTGDDAISPANIFTMYEKGFLSKFIEEKNENGTFLQIIDLTPTDKKKAFFKVKLCVNKTEKLVIRATVFDKNGNHYIYSVDKFTPNVPIDDASFTFNKASHPGVEVVDLR